MKNPTATMFLHQNVIINNKLCVYNQATGTYQEAYVQPQPQPFQYVQPKFQQVVYVQPQPQPQQVFYRNTKPLQYVVQPQQVFYNNPPQKQQAAYNYPPKVFPNNVPIKLTESRYITKEEAEKIMRDLDKKFPKQPIQNNNDRPLPNNVYSGTNYCDDLSGGTGSTNVASNSSSDKNNCNDIDITPSSKFNISPNQVLQPFNFDPNCKFCTKNK